MKLTRTTLALALLLCALPALASPTQVQTSQIANGAVTTAKQSTTGVSAATYGDGTHVAQIAVGVDGRITSASAVTITGAAPTGSAGGGLTGSYPNPTLANPSASTLGGIQSLAAVSHNFLTSIGTGGVATQAQPAFTDIYGTAATGQLPSLPASQITSGTLALTVGGTSANLSATGGTSQYLKQATSGGAVTVGVIAYADLPAGTPGNPRINSVASSATPAINVGTTDQFEITALAANITSMSSGLSGSPGDGQHLLIRFLDNGTARTITWGSSFASSGVATLLATTVISKTSLVLLVYDSNKSKWICMAVDAVGY